MERRNTVKYLLEIISLLMLISCQSGPDCKDEIIKVTRKAYNGIVAKKIFKDHAPLMIISENNKFDTLYFACLQDKDDIWEYAEPDDSIIKKANSFRFIIKRHSNKTFDVVQ